MKAKQLVPIAVLVAAAAVAAAQEPEDAMQRMQGEVLMLTPAVLQLASDQGVIEDFEVTPDSRIEDGVVEGDRVTVWYDASGGSKVVVRSERFATDRTQAGAASRGGQETTGTTGSEGRTGMAAETTRQQGRTRPGEAAAQRSRDTGEADWYEQEGTPYPEAVNPPDNAMVGRQGPMLLPDTASALPAAGLLGLAALAAATAVGMLRRRI